MLHVTSRFPIEPENPRGPVVAPSSAWNRWYRGSSLIWSRHTAEDAQKLSSSRRITPSVCPVLTFVPSHPTTFMFSVFALRLFKLVTNDWVMSVLEPDGGYSVAEVRRTWLCHDAYVFFRDGFSVVLVSMPRTCVKV